MLFGTLITAKLNAKVNFPSMPCAYDKNTKFSNLITCFVAVFLYLRSYNNVLKVYLWAGLWRGGIML